MLLGHLPLTLQDKVHAYAPALAPGLQPRQVMLGAGNDCCGHDAQAASDFGRSNEAGALLRLACIVGADSFRHMLLHMLASCQPVMRE